VIGQRATTDDATGIVTLVIVAVLYFVPALVAWSRKVPNVGSVVVINLLLGWTIVGWVVALAMAARSVPVTTSSPAGGKRPQARPEPGAPWPGSAPVRECPYCKEPMRRDASVCPHCRRESPASVMHEGRWRTKDENGSDVWLDEGEGRWRSDVAEGNA
jgi:hypothetical protein